MSDRKYVVLSNPETGREYVVVFDRDLAHKSVAEGIMRETRRSEWGPRMYLEPVAAGFVGDPSRGSESLKLGPRPQDQSLIDGMPPMRTIVSAADGPPAKKMPQPTRSLLDRARGGKGRL